MSTPLASLLNPRSVAVIGASEDQTKFGGRLYKTLLHHRYAGTVYPINPARETLFGLRTYPDIASLPEAPDMVVMALPREKVLEAVTACAERGAKAGIIITSKFSDEGPEGAALERAVVQAAARHGMRLIGPNCLGVISPANQLVLCSSPALNVEQLLVAPIGFVSQSGALMGTLFDRAHGLGIGFSHCVSVGNQADLELCDFIEFLIDDPATQVICSYVEGVKSPERLVALARRARAAGKPWLMVKAGTTADGSRAAYSHTASLAGDFAALQAVCRREGIVLMRDALNMLSLARALVRYPGQRVRNVGVITTSGGGGALTADRLSEAGVPLAEFTAATQAALAELYTPGQANNPIDLGGCRADAPRDLGVRTAQAVLADPNTDLALMSLTTAPDVTGLVRQLITGSASEGLQHRPTLYVMLPGRVAEGARSLLIEHRIPYVDTLAEAVDVLAAWKQWSDYVPPEAPQRPAGGAPLVQAPAGVLGEKAAKALLAQAGIPVNQDVVVRDLDEALAQAPQVGFPLVLKVVSPDIAHKSDVGGVALNLRDAAALQHAFEQMQSRIRTAAPQARVAGYSLQRMESAGALELIVGARHDAQFGAQVIVGAGGVLVELFQDVAVLPAPVDAGTARKALLGLRIAPLLGAYRGRGALDVEAVVDAVVRMGWLAHDLAQSPSTQDFEIEVNPLQVRLAGQGVVAVDARARLEAAPPVALSGVAAPGAEALA